MPIDLAGTQATCVGVILEKANGRDNGRLSVTHCVSQSWDEIS